MNRLNALSVAALFLLFVASGCAVSPVGEEAPLDFNGTWFLASTALQKTSCPGAPVDARTEEIVIIQEESQITLRFADHSAWGSILDGALLASGRLSDGRAVSIQLMQEGDLLEGTLSIAGGGCQEERAVIASRRRNTVDVDGHWGFDLAVAGDQGCSDIVNYRDCFRIIQTETDLLVVDEEAGNLFGAIHGNVAHLTRNGPEERTTLIFRVNDERDQIVGTAVRFFPGKNCQTQLKFTGVTRSQPCAGGL